MKNIYCLLFLFAILLMGCSTLKSPVVTRFNNRSISDYKYFYVVPTSSVSSSSGVYIYSTGVTTTTTVNPADVISGFLFKKGFVRVHEILPENATNTMIISYGETGRRMFDLGYATEVTIQITDASTQTLIAVTTAEGKGASEADNVRVAIINALTPLVRE